MCSCTSGYCPKFEKGLDCPYEGTPLQEQVEQVEDALQKALNVIEAFVVLEKELRNDVYQAQLDALDWMNKYNIAAAPRDPDYEQLRARVYELTHLNAELEVRNERQSEIIMLAQHYVAEDVARVLRGEIF